LHREQGLGDTLQFVRYAPLVQRRGGKVLILAPANWLPILRTCVGLDPATAEFCDEALPLPKFDVYAALLTVPGLFGTDLSILPADVPYLSAPAGAAERWQDALGERRGPRVGIAWQGNPKFAGDRLRSIPLAEFAPLAAVEGARLYSLQVGYGAEQLGQVAFPVTDLGSRFGDEVMVDAAGAIAGLDLVVSCDSAVAHLAGALAAPVWTALPKSPDWRWMLDRNDSPWYPTMRLFRQSQAGDWTGVFAQMAAELASFSPPRRTASTPPERPAGDARADSAFID
jgi:hypothetical protein